MSLGLKAGKVNKELKEKFLDSLNDDLNTPQALAVLQEVFKSKLSNEDKLATVLDFDKVLGLKFKEMSESLVEELPEQVKDLIIERQSARERGDWNESDRLRVDIEKLGYEVRDEGEGMKVFKK